MARNGIKSGGRNFEKNDPRRQNGAVPLSPEIKEIRALTKEEFITRFQKYCFKPVDELKELQKDSSLQALDAVFIKALLTSISTGEYRFIQECVDRLLGKTKQIFEHSGPHGEPIHTAADINFKNKEAAKKLIAEVRQELDLEV